MEVLVAGTVYETKMIGFDFVFRFGWVDVPQESSMRARTLLMMPDAPASIGISPSRKKVNGFGRIGRWVGSRAGWGLYANNSGAITARER